MGEVIENKVAEVTGSIVDRIVREILSELSDLSTAIIAVVCIGIIGYILYNCILMMFFGKPEVTQKIIFGYFLLLLGRILSVLVIFKR